MYNFPCNAEKERCYKHLDSQMHIQAKGKYVYKNKKDVLTPASVAMGFPRRLNSDSSSIIVLLIRD